MADTGQEKGYHQEGQHRVPTLSQHGLQSHRPLSATSSMTTQDHLASWLAGHITSLASGPRGAASSGGVAGGVSLTRFSTPAPGTHVSPETDAPVLSPRPM